MRWSLPQQSLSFFFNALFDICIFGSFSLNILLLVNRIITNLRNKWCLSIEIKEFQYIQQYLNICFRHLFSIAYILEYWKCNFCSKNNSSNKQKIVKKPAQDRLLRKWYLSGSQIAKIQASQNILRDYTLFLKKTSKFGWTLDDIRIEKISRFLE